MSRTRKITVTAMLSAIATILMFIQLPFPLMPGFIKIDISELPALIASMAFGPVWGVGVCFVKNLLHLLNTTTSGVGELSNFLLGSVLVLPAGIIYHRKKNRKSALLGLLVGSLVMAIISLPINYFITYPVYARFMPIDAIIGAYQAIFPKVNGLLSCLIIFNMPFTFFKGLLSSGILFAIYKRISHLIKGKSE